MRNKKIVINIDLENKRVRKGFIDSQTSDKKIKKEKNEKDFNKTKKVNKKNDVLIHKKQVEKVDLKENELEFTEHIEENTYNPEVEYINKNELEKISEGINIVNKHKKKDKLEREKRIGKTLKEMQREKKELENYDETINFRPVLLSFFVIAIIVLLYIFFQYGPILGISLKLNNKVVEPKIDIVSSEGDIYANYNNELLVYSNKVISTYNKNGKKTWTYTFEEMFTPNIYIKDNYMIVANNTNGNIYVFENKKEILNKKVDGKINNIFINDGGYIAIEYASNAYKKIIGVFNKNGKNIYNAYLENQTIADVKIIDNAKKIIVTKITSTSFKSGIEIVLLDSTKQENNITQIAKLDNNFVYDLTIQARNIIMLLDNKLIKINIDTHEQEVIKSFESSQLLYFTLNDNYYTCVEKELNNESNEYSINNMRFDGTLISNLKVHNSPKMLTNTGLLNYFIYQDSYSVVNKWGIEIKNKKINTAPKEIVVFNNEKSLALIYTNVICIENL